MVDEEEEQRSAAGHGEVLEALQEPIRMRRVVRVEVEAERAHRRDDSGAKARMRVAECGEAEVALEREPSRERECGRLGHFVNAKCRAAACRQSSRSNVAHIAKNRSEAAAGSRETRANNSAARCSRGATARTVHRREHEP